MWVGLEGQLQLSEKGLLCIEKKKIPPNNVFACKTYKYILTYMSYKFEDLQTKRILRNLEWGPVPKVGFSQGLNDC